MVSEREEQLSQRDGEVQQLQAHVARMLGVPAPEARALTAAAVPHQQPAPGEWAQRVAELEAANERLEQALVQTNNRGGAASPGPPAGGCDTEDGDAVAALTIQLAEREGQLQAARQQVEELEALQHLARVRPLGVGISVGSSRGGQVEMLWLAAESLQVGQLPGQPFSSIYLEAFGSHPALPFPGCRRRRCRQRPSCWMPCSTPPPRSSSVMSCSSGWSCPTGWRWR